MAASSLRIASELSMAQGSEPSPPALETAMASALPCAPAIGACTIGRSIPRSFCRVMIGASALLTGEGASKPGKPSARLGMRYVTAFGFGPGAVRGEYPDTRHCKASILLPFSKRVKLHVMISPAAARLARLSRTVASDMPVSSAISKSRHCPCFFKHCRTCITTQTMNRVVNARYLSPKTSPVG